MSTSKLQSMAEEAEGLSPGEGIAMAVAVAWMVVVGIYFWMLPAAAEGVSSLDGPRMILLGLAIFGPVGLIWLAGVLARTNKRLRMEAAALRAEVARLDENCESLRQMQLATAAMAPKPQPVAVPAVAQNAGAPVTRFTSRREISRLIVPRAAPQSPSDQPKLELVSNNEPEVPDLDRPDLIRALNFPNDEHDTEGFAALRRALRDRTARRLVQASQDVLTLLSQDGIYMDDLTPGKVPPGLWRRFAEGERGKELDALGAVRNPDMQHSIAARMREDTIFRDAVHHFLRRFDQMLMTFCAQGTDADLDALAETRTARAFMLLGRATGTFD